jgi:ribosomal protein L24
MIDRNGTEIKEGDSVYVHGTSTPGHQQAGYSGKVFSVLSSMVIVEGRGAPNGRASTEWPKHLTVQK